LCYRFYSTEDPEALSSLDEYISRMKPDQDTILYLPGDSKEAILRSPILKMYVKKGYEVLLLPDPIDEFCFQHLSEYEKRKVKSIAKDDVSLIDNGDELAKKRLQKLKEMYKPLTDWWKKFLGSDVEKVSISNKLEDDPLYILTSQYGYSATMEKINRAQALSSQEKSQSYMKAKKTLELNPNHPAMRKMLEHVKDSVEGKLDESVEELATVLYNMALLNSGFNIDRPTDFTNPLQRLINVGFGLKRDQEIEEIELDIDLDEESKKEEEEEEISPEDLEVEELSISDKKEDAEPVNPHDEL
jgi:heat shock protein beta